MPSDNVCDVPKWLTISYKSMDDRWKSKQLESLRLFIKPYQSNSTNTPQIILLQHFSEISRKSSATGWLLDNYIYFKRYPHYRDEDCNLNLQVQRWIYTGRGDAKRTEEKIEKLRKMRRVFLLWTDSNGEEPSIDVASSPAPETYIILDGTWQQAKSMFRKTPSLWKLPRISLQSNVPPSSYVLRGDYSGWKERFSNSVDSANLLCTAEVAAAVLDRCGEGSSANTIRTRLDIFQDSVLRNKRRSISDDVG